VALRRDGSLVAWGNVDFDDDDFLTPPAGNDFKAIAAGYQFGLALRRDGSLAAWGDMKRVPSGHDFTAIAAGYDFGLAVKRDGSLVGWDGAPDVPYGTLFTAVDGGLYQGVALRSDGFLAGWGDDSLWAVPDTPEGNGFTAVSAGNFHNAALRSDGSIVIWGWDNYGQRSGMPASTAYTAVSAGNGFTVAILRAGAPPVVIPGFGQRTAVKVQAPRRRIVGRGPLDVTIANDNDFPIYGWLSARAGSVKLPGHKFTGVRAHSKRLTTLRLSKRLQRLVKRRHNLRLRLIADVADPWGHDRRVRTAVRLISR
jgi:hypothetical protein